MPGPHPWAEGGWQVVRGGTEGSPGCSQNHHSLGQHPPPSLFLRHKSNILWRPCLCQQHKMERETRKTLCFHQSERADNRTTGKTSASKTRGRHGCEEGLLMWGAFSFTRGAPLIATACLDPGCLWAWELRVPLKKSFGGEKGRKPNSPAGRACSEVQKAREAVSHPLLRPTAPFSMLPADLKQLPLTLQ